MQRESDSYTITRVINNNVITSIDGKENEVVLMGKGISFQKRVGDSISKEKVEKEFVLKGLDKNRYLDLINDIPSDYLDLAIEVIDLAEEKLKVKANPKGYIMLADHINFSIDRSKNNIVIKNEMLNEIKNFYYKEYEIGEFAVKEIKKRFNINLPVDEIGFIAFHIVNLSGSFSNSDNMERLNLINKIIEIIESYFSITLDRESIYFERFLTHLKYFSVRAFSESKLTNLKDDFVFRMMKVQYPEITKCVELVQEYLDYNYQIEVSTEEKGYLIIHINNLLIKTR